MVERRYKQRSEISIRVIGDSALVVASALNSLKNAFPEVVITGIKENEREPGFRGYAFCKLEGD